MALQSALSKLRKGGNLPRSTTSPANSLSCRVSTITTTNRTTTSTTTTTTPSTSMAAHSVFTVEEMDFFNFEDEDDDMLFSQAFTAMERTKDHSSSSTTVGVTTTNTTATVPHTSTTTATVGVPTTNTTAIVHHTSTATASVGVPTTTTTMECAGREMLHNKGIECRNASVTDTIDVSEKGNIALSTKDKLDAFKFVKTKRKHSLDENSDSANDVTRIKKLTNSDDVISSSLGKELLPTNVDGTRKRKLTNSDDVISCSLGKELLPANVDGTRKRKLTNSDDVISLGKKLVPDVANTPTMKYTTPIYKATPSIESEDDTLVDVSRNSRVQTFATPTSSWSKSVGMTTPIKSLFRHSKSSGVTTPTRVLQHSGTELTTPTMSASGGCVTPLNRHPTFAAGSTTPLNRNPTLNETRSITPLNRHPTLTGNITPLNRNPAHTGSATPLNRTPIPLICTPVNTGPSASVGILRTPGSLARRKFPGPAGILPPLAPGQNLDKIHITPPSTPAPSTPRVSKSHNIPVPSTIPQSGNDDDDGLSEDFLQGPWIEMMEDMDLNDTYSSSLLNYSISQVIKQSSRKTLTNGKVVHLRAMLKHISPSGKTASAILKDPSGEIMCTVHSQVLEEYYLELRPGAVLVLRQVSVFSPGPRRHYLNITPPNVVHIYSPNKSSQPQRRPLLQILSEIEQRFSEDHDSSSCLPKPLAKPSHTILSTSNPSLLFQPSPASVTNLGERQHFASHQKAPILCKQRGLSSNISFDGASLIFNRKLLQKEELDRERRVVSVPENHKRNSEFTDNGSSNHRTQIHADVIPRVADSAFFSSLCEDDFDELFADIADDNFDR